MHLLHLLAVLSLLPLLPRVLSAPTDTFLINPLCKSPKIRKEWRTLSIKERKSYTNAIKCLHSRPGKLLGLYPGSKTRFEDFATAHKLRTPKAHWTGQFLIWHRLFLAEFERVLEEECGYKGGQPYWDYTIDAATGNFTHSVIFDHDHGFGGNGPYTGYPKLPELGLWGGGCVDTGPFKDFKYSVSPKFTFYEENPKRCLIRNMNMTYQDAILQKHEDVVMKQTNFYGMTARLEGLPFGIETTLHAGGHFVVGAAGSNGTAAEVWTSNLEPLFYLHHANLDRIWWEWQHLKPEYKWSHNGFLQSRFPNALADDKEHGLEEGPLEWDTEVDLAGLPGKFVKGNVGEMLSTWGEVSPGGQKSPLCYLYGKSPKKHAVGW